MIAVDWYLFGEHVCTWAGMLTFATIVIIGLTIVIDVGREWLRDRAWPHTPVDSSTNVVRLVPRARPFDWSADDESLRA